MTILVPAAGGLRQKAHRMVAKVAHQMAEDVYEENCSKTDQWRVLWPDRKAWVRSHRVYFLEAARATLAQMLTGTLPEHLKEEIKDALVKDNAFRVDREKGNGLVH